MSQNKLDEACFKHDVEILNIYQEEQRLIKHYVIKHLILLTIESKIDIKGVLLQCFIIFLDKKSSDSNSSGNAIKREIMPSQQLAKE